jgi:hypothetical protein
MAVIKYTCPPQSSGQGSFSDNLVGFQIVDGGGFTQGNFQFTTSITEKTNRTFNIGSFSDPISLDTMNVDTLLQSRIDSAKNLQVYPNFDLSEITNFALFGSLSKRLSVSVSRIINFFPAALEVVSSSYSFSNIETAININYNQVNNETYLEIYLNVFINPFDIDYTVNSSRNIELREIETSYLRNFTVEYKKYSLFFEGNEYPITFFAGVEDGETKMSLYVQGRPFGYSATTSQNFIIRPQDVYVNEVFSNDLDEVENYLLNRDVTPEYTAFFNKTIEDESGRFIFTKDSVTFPKYGTWNLDITTSYFNDYLKKLNEIGESLDSYRTNLISRFLTTGALKEFDTPDQKIEKVLQLYGRSFDETRKFIISLANMNSVNYNVGNDIPSQLLKNLAQTLGWSTNTSPISEEFLLTSLFQRGTNEFEGLPVGKTPDELNFQFYRNLIMNSAFLFKSKGTRKSIEILLRLIGAPEALVDFNEYIYVADQKISINQFETRFAKISAGTYVDEVSVIDPTEVYTIFGVPYTAFTTSPIIQDITTLREDYPIDRFGFPSMPRETEDYFFQIGGGWFESTPQHRMPESFDPTISVFTGENPSYQTSLKPFNYGEEYLDRYKNFPYLNMGFKLRKTLDNKKSWTNSNIGVRSASDGGFTAYYRTEEDKLVLNVKNVDIFLNPGQGLLYDVWSMSRTYNFPIPEQGLSYVEPTKCNPFPNTPYPKRGGIDWTESIPKPREKSFFEFAQTFWHNMINVRNRQFITDGKTGGYPTLQSIFWKYLESNLYVNIPNDEFTYQKMIDYVNGLGDYWIRLIEQMVPATTIWNTGVRYENSIFHRQKFVWRRQCGCQIIPIPCKPCSLTTQILPFDCPIQTVECDLYPWINNPQIKTFGDVLTDLLNEYIESLDGVSNCNYESLTTSWYVDIRIDGTNVVSYQFFNGYGYSNPLLSIPSETLWRNSVNGALASLLPFGLSYNIIGDKIYVFNNNCEPIEVSQIFELNVGIDFDILCAAQDIENE